MRYEALVHVRTVVFRGAIRSAPVHQASNRSPSHSSTGAPAAATPGRRAVRGGARRRQSGRGSQRSRRPRGASRGRRRPIVGGGRSSLGAHGPRPKLGGRRRDAGAAVPTDRCLTPGTTLCPRCCPEPVTLLEALATIRSVPYTGGDHADQSELRHHGRDQSRGRRQGDQDRRDQGSAAPHGEEDEAAESIRRWQLGGRGAGLGPLGIAEQRRDRTPRWCRTHGR